MRRTIVFLGTWFAAALLAACVVVPALAAENPWYGTWKMDVAKSHLTGQTISYTKQANGLDQFSDGAMTYDFTANGIDYQVGGGSTESWAFAGPNTWKVTDKQKGTVTATTDVKLSPNCKTMTTVETGTRPDGSAIHEEETYTKVKSDGCLEGTWKSVKMSSNAPSKFIISAGSAPDTWKWDIPDQKESVEGKTDGSDSPVTGPTAPSDLTVSFKMDGPRKVDVAVKLGGKTLSQGEDVLAANGKTFTGTSWTPGKENEKAAAVYVKQK
ncbi:MAG TPA: hypothetical protein VHX13_12535 [Acidobacteriaceae bacterium]|jgi:hypothetical protein|nr:hypothetical protein [Acidobacteriaceae bacterium]